MFKTKLLSIRTIICFTFIIFSYSQAKIEPANWWSGMKYNNLTLMFYGDSIGFASNFKINSNNIKIQKISKSESPNYIFIDVKINKNINPSIYKFTYQKNNINQSIDFPILKREKRSFAHLGFDNSDVIYLITPDRFSNGDLTNDKVQNYIESVDINNPNARHGGDIQGIIDRLDYLNNLGITAIWINPLTENNTNVSYHGYASTNLYNIDARFGTNELYKKLVEEAQKRNIKVIIDHVSNHISIDHPWIKDLPYKDWLNGSLENHLPAFHDKMVLTDIYVDSSSIDKLQKGWFVDSMPDLNQKNPMLSKYLIQNALWWIEFSGINGIREDTYPYADQKFLAEFNKTILDEYPKFNIVGEVWSGETVFLAHYQHKSFLPKSFDSYLPSVTDFALRDVLSGYLRNEKSLYHIFETIAKDYIYPNPNNLVTFIDNHDVARIMYEAKGNIEKAKKALFLLLTLRGIPQILYGTEIGLVGTPEHGYLREGFPGGFPHHKRNAFNYSELSDKEADIFNFLQTILKLRKENSTITKGKLIHFPIDNNIYTYIKKGKNEMFVFIVNDNPFEKTISLNAITKKYGYNNIPNIVFTSTKMSEFSNNQVKIGAQDFIILNYVIKTP